MGRMANKMETTIIGYTEQKSEQIGSSSDSGSTQSKDREGAVRMEDLECELVRWRHVPTWR